MTDVRWGLVSARQWLKTNYFRALFFVYIGVLLFVFTFVVPPFQKADEPGHFIRAVTVANFQLLCHKNDEGDYYVTVQRKYAELQSLIDVRLLPQKKSSFDLLRVDLSDRRYDEDVDLIGDVYSYCALPHVGELPAATGMLLTKAVGNSIVSFYAGRIADVLFFLFCLWLSLRCVPQRYKLVVYLYCAVPMVLHQVSAINYDAVELSLVPVLFSLLVKFLSEDKPIAWREGLIALVVLWLMINAKSGYYALVLLYFLIPYQRIAPDKKRYVLQTAALGLFGGITTIGLALLYGSETTIQSKHTFVSQSLFEDQLVFIWSHPATFVQVCVNTLTEYGDPLLRQGIGVFGWLEYGFRNALLYSVIVFSAGVALYVIAVEGASAGRLLSVRQLAWLWLIVLLVVLSVIVGLYAVVGPTGGKLVEGLQGRYFLPLVPFIGLAVAELVGALGKETTARVAAGLLAAILVADLIWAVSQQYY